MDVWPTTAFGWIAFVCTLYSGIHIFAFKLAHDRIATELDDERVTSPRGWTKRDEREYRAYLLDVLYRSQVSERAP